jgi:hypothetical protein
MARYDLDIDHRIVSVVQIDDDVAASTDGGNVGAVGHTQAEAPADAGAAPAMPPAATRTGEEAEASTAAHAAEPARTLVESVSVRTAGIESHITVTLRLGTDSFDGTAAGSSSPVSRPRLVARATLAALDELLGTPAEVEHAVVVPVGSRQVAVSVVLVQVPRIGEQLLSGSAVVRGDEADAVARSVLDALNRRLTG